jgi:hypothetical protein
MRVSLRQVPQAVLYEAEANFVLSVGSRHETMRTRGEPGEHEGKRERRTRRRGPQSMSRAPSVAEKSAATAVARVVVQSKLS